MRAQDGGTMRACRRHARAVVLLRLLIASVFSCSTGAKGEPAATSPPALTIQDVANGVRLELNGTAGTHYAIESALDLRDWRPFAVWNQLKPTQEWVHPASGSHRFFRARLANEPQPFVFNFRLTDQTDRSHELYYQSTSRAVVVLFLDFDCAETGAALGSLKLLKDRFENRGVRFWILDASGEPNRSKMKQHAIGLEMPVLHDRGLVVTRTADVRTGPEAWLIDTSTWKLVYRGAVGALNSLDSAPEHGFLSDAIDRFLAGQPVQFLRTPPGDCGLAPATRPVPSYSADIAPLLQAKCVGCHSPGNIAPWSMTNHTIVQTYSTSIKQQLLTGQMPPWHADPEFGHFSNDTSLTPEQRAALVDWIDSGAPRGDGPDPLAETKPPKEYPFDWPAGLGEPDVILTIPTQNIRAFGEEPYHYIDVPVNLETDAWVRAAVVLPGNVRVVHHCLVYFGDNALFRGLDGFFAGYVPGTSALAFPERTGKFLPKSATLEFQMHYTTTGEPETDTTRLGLYLHKEKPALELKTRSAFKVFFAIPPGASDYGADAQFTFAKDSLLFEMSPHMHYRGSRFRYEAVYPNGEREVLLNVPKYEFDWQTLYRLAEPKFMPAGTKLICVGAWDNSPQNPDNPDPNKTIRFGEQSDDEMFIGYFNFAELP